MRLLTTMVVLASLVLALPALAETAPATGATSAAASLDDPPVKRAVRQYGDGPVAVQRGQRMELRFRGQRGDRVRLANVYGRNRSTYYGYVFDSQVSLASETRRATLDKSGFFRLRESGWHTLRYQAGDYRGVGGRVQLMLQHRLRAGSGATVRLPERLGHQYAVWLRAARAGLEVTSFGTELSGLVSGDRYFYNVRGESLLLSPGLSVQHGDPTYAVSKPLRAHERVLVVVESRTRPGG